MKSFVDHDVSLTKQPESNNYDSEISEENNQHSDGPDDEGCGSSVEEVRINQEGRDSDESSQSDLFEMIAARNRRRRVIDDDDDDGDDDSEMNIIECVSPELGM